MAEAKSEFRCAQCHKLLARTDGNTEIKCPRCGSLNEFKPSTTTIRFIRRVNKRTTSSGLQF